MNRVADRDYIVPIKGLSLGKHQYGFTIDDNFFDGYEGSEITSADIKVDLTLDRHTTFMEIKGVFEGIVKSECDRCLEELDLELDFETSLLVKFTRTNQEEDNEEVLILDPSESELDMKQFFYDYVCLALPLQKVHLEGECDPRMIEKLEKLRGESDILPEGRTPFDKLKDLMN